MCKLVYITLITGFLTVAIEAQAYVGPGIGAGTLGVVLGLLASIFIAVFAIFWYPVKRMLNRKTKGPATKETQGVEDDKSHTD